MALRLLRELRGEKGQLRGKGQRPSQNEASHTVHELHNVEVDQQATTESSCTEVREQLRAVNWVNRFDCFQFDNEVAFDQQIDAQQAVERRPFVLDRYENFAREADVSGDEFVLQRGSIGGLEKSRPEVSVYLDGGTYHALCEYVWSNFDVEAWHSFVGWDWCA